MAPKKGTADAQEQRFRVLATKAGWPVRVSCWPKRFQGMAVGVIFVHLEKENRNFLVWRMEHVPTWDVALRRLIEYIEQRKEIAARFTAADLHLD